MSIFSTIKFVVEAPFSLLMPLFELQEPTGPYKVGTTTYDWTDTSRQEEKCNGDVKRELMVQVWYPAENIENLKKAPYIKDAPEIIRGLEKFYLIKPFLLRRLKDVQTHSFINAQLSSKSDKYPVLIFSHGMTGFRNQNTFQAEELASHGYIVVAVDHPYYAAATVFSNGRVAESTISTDVDSHDFSLEFGDKNNETWVKDVQFVLDKLEEINSKGNDNPFSGRFDMEKVGMFGHSFGGATAAQLLLKDSRVKAGINMDGAFFGSDIPETGIEKPFLLMLSEQNKMTTDLEKVEKKLKMFGIKGERLKEYLALYAECERRMKKAMAGGAYSIVIKKTTHLSYSDAYLYTPLMAIIHKPKKIHKVINDFSLIFFNKYLMEDPTASLENAAHKYNNVEIAGIKKEFVF